MAQHGRIIDRSKSASDQIDPHVPKGTIYLLGDGILDNFYFLGDRSHDLQYEISSLGFRVVNYAVEEARLKDLQEGLEPKEIYQASRSYPYLLEKDKRIHPLQLLATATNVNRSFMPAYGDIRPFGFRLEESIPNTVVLSIGGNDLRASSSANILLGVEYYVNAVMTKEYLDLYESIITSILRRCSRIILVSIYSPYMGSGALYIMYSKVAIPVITKWRQGLETMARKYDLPIIDLGRTLNNRDKSHYGSSDTNLSEVANQCLAQCITYICQHYRGYNVYYAPDCDITKLTSDHPITESA